MSPQFTIEQDRDIPQRAERRDPQIGREQLILNTDTGERTRVRFWYQGGAIHHVDSVPA